MYAVGLMSGTSLDGLDAALCKIEGHGFDTRITLLDFITYPMPDVLRQRIREACFPSTSSVDLICSLNFEIGQWMSEGVSMLMKDHDIKLDFIASHGQTIYHQPFRDKTHVPSTLQIGEAAVLAYDHHCPVVSHFRVMDMAGGGQGAPLVPYSELILYSRPQRSIGLLNLGGIGNLTWLDGSMDRHHVLAFDTGPGNMMINAAMTQLFSLPYDDEGRVAAKGKVIPALFESLCQHPYLSMQPPKSTGREMFGEDLVTRLIQRYADQRPEDIIRTLTEFTAFCVEDAISRFLSAQRPLDELIVGGGGVHNRTLMAALKRRLAPTSVVSWEEKGLNSDAKEAMAFVIMGHETLAGYPSNVPSVTGAQYPLILGDITPNPFQKG